jgi:hypothetical protein
MSKLKEAIISASGESTEEGINVNFASAISSALRISEETAKSAIQESLENDLGTLYSIAVKFKAQVDYAPSAGTYIILDVNSHRFVFRYDSCFHYCMVL